MKSVFSLALVFGILFAGCAEKEPDPVIVSPAKQENPHSPVLERPAEELPIVEIIPQEVITDWIAPKQEAKQADGYREPDVIYVPTPQNVVDRMLELAQVTKDDIASVRKAYERLGYSTPMEAAIDDINLIYEVYKEMNSTDQMEEEPKEVMRHARKHNAERQK